RFESCSPHSFFNSEFRIMNSEFIYKNQRKSARSAGNHLRNKKNQRDLRENPRKSAGNPSSDFRKPFFRFPGNPSSDSPPALPKFIIFPQHHPYLSRIALYFCVQTPRHEDPYHRR